MYNLVLALAALQVLLATTNRLTLKKLSRRETVVNKGTYIEVCTEAAIDMGIVLDSSNSIVDDDFQKSITFLQEFLDRFDLGSGAVGVRVSIITYGEGIYPQDGFDLDTYNKKADVLEAIGNIPHRSGPRTDTGPAIKYMHTVQLADNVARPWAAKVGVIFTDGNSQRWRMTQQAAKNAREGGITMFAIGVGSDVHEEELLNIAGDESRVTRVDSYDKLDAIKETLASKTCIKERLTTTPTTQQCGELNPSDIYFAFSPADLDADSITWTTSFIDRVISARDMDVGFRYGVVSCPGDADFDLDTYSTVEAYKSRLQQYDDRQLPKVIKRLLGYAYSAESGGRAEVSKVAVIVVSGDDQEAEGLPSLVDQLVKKGVKVYIADPSHSGLKVKGAVTLTGRCSRTQAKALISFLCQTNCLPCRT
ncbi:hypothetical protein BsWGS_22127 [Bradybaena similaris]